MEPEHPIQFFTATILNWKHLLKPDKYKHLIISSLKYLVSQNRINLLAFVIMPNHLHLIWRINNGHKREAIQRDFLKYTAQQIRFDLQANHPQVLERFRVNAKDRTYQIWERNPLSVDLFGKEMIEQKLQYIHLNPLQDKWKLVQEPEEYVYSSAQFYATGDDALGLLTDYQEVC
jgi:REP element-mobilizing transposase RayT